MRRVRAPSVSPTENETGRIREIHPYDLTNPNYSRLKIEVIVPTLSSQLIPLHGRRRSPYFPLFPFPTGVMMMDVRSRDNDDVGTREEGSGGRGVAFGETKDESGWERGW